MTLRITDEELRALQDTLCHSLCAAVTLEQTEDERIIVDTPFEFPDGDAYVFSLELLPVGGVRISDCGHTMMRLSYTMDVDKLREGTRGRIFSRIVADAGVRDDDGVFSVEAVGEDLGPALLRFGMFLTQMRDLTFLNKARVESTFYDDLRSAISSVLPSGKVEADYVVPGVPDGMNYRVDFCVKTPRDPLFVFGVPNRDKARLATIVLQHMLQHDIRFESLVVFQNQQEIPRQDLARLTNVAGEMVSSLDAAEDLGRKLRRRAA